MPGPAHSYIDLGALAEGVYILNLSNGKEKKTATLTVTAGSYTLEMSDNGAFGFTEGILNRIPEETIWGYVDYNSDTHPTLPEQLFEDIEAEGAVKTQYTPGFEIADDGYVVQHPPDNPDHPHRHRNFVYHYAGDISKIDALVERYGREYGDEPAWAHVTVYTERGEEFLSWMYDR